MEGGHLTHLAYAAGAHALICQTIFSKKISIEGNTDIDLQFLRWRVISFFKHWYNFLQF